MRTAETKFQRELRLRLNAHDWDVCWEWPHGRINGYGFVRIDKRPCRVHRVAYEQLVGPIPEGLVLDHLCRNRLCFNPRHLEIVTRGENVLRGETLAARKASQSMCIHGHPLFGENLVVRTDAKGRTNRQCATCQRRRQRKAA